MNNNHQLIKKQVAAALNEALNDPNRDTGRVELDTFIKEIIKNKHEEQNKKSIISGYTIYAFFILQ